MNVAHRALALACMLLFPELVAAITNGQLDDFQDTTTQSWTSGAPNPNPPVNVATGGPAGAGDAYLLVTSTGIFGAGGKLITFNQAQWTGNFTAAGITFIEADIANFGASDLFMRIAFEGNGGDFSSVNAITVPADGVWRHLHFPIGAGDLTGGLDAAMTLQTVFEMRILSNPSPSIHGDMVVGQMGIDNITCGPVPRIITQWRSIRTHGPAGALGIVLDPTASGNGPAGPTTESRQGGIQSIAVDFSFAPTVAPGAVTVTGRTTVGGVLQGPVTYTPTSVGMISATTLQITFAPGLLPDKTCYTIDISPAGVPGLTGDHDVNVRALTGDTTSSGLVNLSDALATKSRIGGAVASNAQFDVDLSGDILLADALAAKTAVGAGALCP